VNFEYTLKQPLKNGAMAIVKNLAKKIQKGIYIKSKKYKAALHTELLEKKLRK